PNETSKEFSQIVTVKENSPSHYIESLSVAGVKDKEKIGDLNHNNKVTNDKTLSNESEEIDKITSNAGDDKSLFIFGQKSSHVEELQECSEKDTVNEAVVPELTEERVTCAVSTSLDDNAPTVESPVDNDSTNQVCDTVTSNLSIPHLPLVKSLSASGLVEPCHSSVPPSRTVPEETAAGLPPASVKVSQSPVKLSTTPGIHRRSSDSDLSITPKGNSLTSSGDRSSVTGSGRAFQTICPKLALKKEPIEPMEFPFLTMNKFPPGFVVSIASTVVATSVKLSERISNLEEPESRDAWWMELRKEIRNHMRALSCNAVIGYSENSTICDDVCVLSATGTAAIVNVRPLVNPPTSDTPEPPVSATIPLPATKQLSNMASSLDRTEFEVPPLKPDSGGGKSRLPSDSTEQPESASPGCSLLHLPFKHASLPFPITTIKCGICKKQQVPDLMLATIEPPEGMSVIGRSGLVHAFVLRQKQHVRGEMNACTVSDHLPFIQFDVYKQLVNKLRVNGMNAVFGLKIQICLGEKVMAAVASGTGMCLEALPLPPTPNIKHGGYESKDYTAVMKALQENVKRNREFYQVNQTKATGTALEVEKNTGGEASDTEDSDNEKPDLDLNAGNKDVGLIVVDDEQDIEEVNQLLDSHPPEGFFVTATESLPGLDDLEVVRNLQMFTQILRMRNNSPSNQPPPPIHNDFDKILQGVYYKMRRMTPCALGNFKIRFALPESDDIQICIVGMALGLNDKVRKSVRRRTVGAASKPESAKKSDDGDLIFSLEEDQESSSAHTSKSVKPRSPARVKRQSTHMPPTDRYGVDITPLSYIPGGRIERYLGNLNFFFVRETSGIRESGGPSGFVHSFVAEVLAILRAHVTALGGNALAAFFLNECVILSNPQKNHGQCLINVGGDVVLVSYIV
ncbi:C2 domain-containing protein 5, partial [Homalodisca vitripennis]|uniref:C2 domain-containing protein 5 n=1 Tax=Homalodisca vitripennis TaxID=197043 RepID=UPI001EEBBA11